MNANKKIWFILILTLVLLIPFNIKAASFTVTAGDKVTAGSGEWKSWANKKYKNNTLVYCTQLEYDAPSKCAGDEVALSMKQAAGLNKIINSNLNYVCKEKLITKFFYEYSKNEGRENYSLARRESDGNSNWVASCTNASKIYEDAEAAYGRINSLANNKISFNKSSLEFSYNSSDKKYTASIRIKKCIYDSCQYTCSADNGASVTKSGNKVTVSVDKSKVGKTVKLTCKETRKINVPTYYDCGGTRVQDLLTHSTEEGTAYGDPNSISGTIPTPKLTVKYDTNGATSIKYKGESITQRQLNNESQVFTYSGDAKDLWNGNSNNTIKATKTGYSFDGNGWYYGKKFINWDTNYTAQQLATYLGVDLYTNPIVTVKLKWKSNVPLVVNYKVIYHGNGGYASGGKTIIEDSVNSGSNYSIRSGNTFERDEHTFSGWTTNSNGKDNDGYGWTGWSGTWTWKNGQKGIKNNELHLYAMWQDSCIYEFNNNSSIANRLKMYKDAKANGISRKNLLNFNITDAATACRDYNPDYDPQDGCLYTDQVNQSTENKFNNENLSDYNDQISSTDTISYCLTDFELNKGSNVSYDADVPVKAGMMILNAEEGGVLAEGILTKTCYIYKDDINKYVNNIKQDTFINVNDYISDAKINDMVLQSVITKTTPVSTLEGEFYKVEGAAIIEYKPNAVYAEKITGRPCDSLSSNCTLIGYGIASKFNDAKDNTSNASFSFSIAGEQPFEFNNTNSCPYIVKPEIIKYKQEEDTYNGNIELEFRSIDTKTPFNRSPKSNWNDGSVDIANNTFVNDYIINATNSYGLKNGVKQTPKYTIKLTSSDIQKIRSYNLDNKYDNYETIQVTEGTETKTVNKFLYQLKQGNLDTYGTLSDKLK